MVCTRSGPNMIVVGCRDGVACCLWAGQAGKQVSVLRVLEAPASVQAHQAAGGDQVESLNVW